MAEREAPLLNGARHTMSSTTGTTMLRAAVVSASPLVRAGLRVALEEGGAIEVTATAASLSELVGLASTAIDVVVADAADVGDDAVATLGAPLLLLTGEDDASPAEWVAEGVSLVPRDAPGRLIAAAAVAAAAGLVALSPGLAADAMRPARPPVAEGAGTRRERLTVREMQVLEKLAAGMGNKAIAESLHISAHTAKFHVAQIIAKLDAASRAHAVAKALRTGLLEA